MKRIFLFCCLFLLLYNSTNAELITIGTAQFNGTGTEYKLIYDADSPFGPIIWLDYTNGLAQWANQKAWAAGLNGILTYDIAPGYAVDFGAGSWRLPNAGLPSVTGYDQISSEMGHLFYSELGLQSFEIRGEFNYYTTEQINILGFNNLFPDWYWDSTGLAGNPLDAWAFSMDLGRQDHYNLTSGRYGLAIRGGQVSTVPEPSTIILLGLGILGFAGVRRNNQIKLNKCPSNAE